LFFQNPLKWGLRTYYKKDFAAILALDYVYVLNFDYQLFMILLFQIKYFLKITNS